MVPPNSSGLMQDGGARSWTIDARSTALGTLSRTAMTRSHHENALPEDDLVFFLLDLIPQIDAAEGWALAGKAKAQRNPRGMREHG